jgi:cytoskeletal protein CcmA (bactofilin family)
MAETQDGWTIIGSDTVIKGEMAVENRARILGRFEGSIKSKGHVEVADKATCKAVIEASIVQVDGAVEGNITATEKVQLNATARMTGDLIAAKLVVTEGAAFTGHITVGPNALKGRTAETATRSESSPPRESAGHMGSEKEPALAQAKR